MTRMGVVPGVAAHVVVGCLLLLALAVGAALGQGYLVDTTGGRPDSPGLIGWAYPFRTVTTGLTSGQTFTAANATLVRFTFRMASAPSLRGVPEAPRESALFRAYLMPWDPVARHPLRDIQNPLRSSSTYTLKTADYEYCPVAFDTPGIALVRDQMYVAFVTTTGQDLAVQHDAALAAKYGDPYPNGMWVAALDVTSLAGLMTKDRQEDHSGHDLWFRVEFGGGFPGDGDSVSDETEAGAPNGGDGNGDGIPDSQRGNAASLPSAVAGHPYVTVCSPQGTSLFAVRALSTADASPPADPLPTTVECPFGLFQFAVEGVAPGGHTSVVMLCPPGVRVGSYWKYGPTPDDHSAHWYRFSLEASPGTTDAEMLASLPGGRTPIRLHFMDAGPGGDNLTYDSRVVDAGGPALDHPPAAADDAATTDEHVPNSRLGFESWSTAPAIECWVIARTPRMPLKSASCTWGGARIRASVAGRLHRVAVRTSLAARDKDRAQSVCSRVGNA